MLQTNGAGQLSFGSVSPGGTTGQVQINNAGAFGAISSGTSGQVLTSNGAGVAPSFATPSGGLSVIDTYCLTSNTGLGGPYVLTGWTRNTPTMTPLGGGITNTSGVFSFPSTGYWEINGNFHASTDQLTDVIVIQFSTDSGSTWSGIDSIKLFRGTGNARMSYAASVIVNITNISTFRVRVEVTVGGVFATEGGVQSTSLTFKKLA